MWNWKEWLIDIMRVRRKAYQVAILRRQAKNKWWFGRRASTKDLFDVQVSNLALKSHPGVVNIVIIRNFGNVSIVCLCFWLSVELYGILEDVPSWTTEKINSGWSVFWPKGKSDGTRCHLNAIRSLGIVEVIIIGTKPNLIILSGLNLSYWNLKPKNHLL